MLWPPEDAVFPRVKGFRLILIEMVWYVILFHFLFIFWSYYYFGVRFIRDILLGRLGLCIGWPMCVPVTLQDSSLFQIWNTWSFPHDRKETKKYIAKENAIFENYNIWIQVESIKAKLCKFVFPALTTWFYTRNYLIRFFCISWT